MATPGQQESNSDAEYDFAQAAESRIYPKQKEPEQHGRRKSSAARLPPSYQAPPIETQNKCRGPINQDYGAAKYKDHGGESETRRRKSSAARLPPSYQAHTIEALNKCRGPINQDYGAAKYKDHGGESETSSDAEYDLAQATESRIYSTQKEPGRHGYCVQQTDEEESWTTSNVGTKIVDGLYKLKETVDKIATSYNKEKISHITHPPVHKTTQTKRKTTARPSVRPLSAVSEEILYLRKHIDIIETAIHVLLKGQKTDKKQVEVLRGKIASIDAENISLRSSLRSLQEEVDALDRRNQELVLELSSKREESTVYSSGKRKPVKEKEMVLPVKISKTNEENARLKRIESAHQICEKKHKKNEAEIQRLMKIIDQQTSNEKMLRYEVETVKKDCLKSHNRSKDYEGEMKKLEKRCRDQRLEIDLKNQEISQLKTETAMESEQIKQMTVNIERRKKEMADSNLFKRKNEKLCEENTSLKENIKTIEEENGCLKRDLDRINIQTIERERNWKRFANEKENHLKGLQEEMTKKNREIDQMKVECKYIHGLENKHKELKASVSRIYQEKDSKIASLQSDIEGLSKRCETLKQKNVDYEGTIEELNDIREDYKKLKKEYNDQERSVTQLTKERNDVHRDKDNADKKCEKMAKEIKDREDEAERLADKLATTEETLSALVEENTRLRQSQSHDLAGMNQKLQRENKTLQSEFERVVSNFEEKISLLDEENRKLRRSPDHSVGIIQKLERQNTSLQSELERVSSNLDQLKRDYTEVKKEKDHTLKRLSSVAGAKLKDDNDIALLSDENRPVNLGEKFSQLYDEQWTDAIENLEENLRFGETDGIRRLLNILKRVFDECVRISDDQFTQLNEITGTTNLPSDLLKKLKDLRKSTALQSVKNVKQLVNKTMSSFFSNEKIACQSYIDRSTELCWLMCVQDPPVVIDFTAVRGQEVNDKTFRKFTKTGSKIDFLVWPMIRLHENGPLLQKGVVQPL